MKKVVIILGAGAVKAWDALLTPELTNLILKDNTFLTKSGVPLAQFVHDRLTEFYRGSTSEINFETILNSLEAIQSYYMNKTTVGGRPNFISSNSVWYKENDVMEDLFNFEFIPDTFVEGHGTVRNLADNNTYGNIPPERAEAAYINQAIRHYLNLIRDKVSHYSTVAETNTFSSLNDKVKEFFIHLLDSGYIPRVYTTNYDRLLPNIFEKDKELNFFDGFDEQIGENGFGKIYQYNISKILNDTNCLSYYCLHGSIFWEYNSNNSEIVYQYVCSPKQSHTYGFYNYAEYTNPSESTFIYNIVTGYNKLQRISIEPLNSFHSVFSQDCINAQMIITIGYSFSDFHINRPIKNAFRFNDAKLLHISFGDASYQIGREFEYLKNEILHMRHDFRKGTQVDDRWIKSTNCQQIIFYKGFKEFLEQMEWTKCNI